MYSTVLKEYHDKDSNLMVKIEVVDWCCGSNWFNDLYTESPHIGGITVTSPTADGRHYIGQYTPKELASDFAKQGRCNPSKEAYESLCQELEHYITASDCSLKCTVSRNGIELNESHGITFDYSYVYGELLEDMANRMLIEYGNDFITEAIEGALEAITGLIAV